MQDPAQPEWGSLKPQQPPTQTEAARRWKEHLETRQKGLEKEFKQKLEKRTAKIIERVLSLLPKNEGFTLLIDDVSVRGKGYFHLKIAGEATSLPPVQLLTTYEGKTLDYDTIESAAKSWLVQRSLMSVDLRRLYGMLGASQGEFYKERAERYIKAHIASPDVRKFEVVYDLFFANLETFKGKPIRILEMGSGSGYTSRSFLKAIDEKSFPRIKEHYLADLSPPMRKHALQVLKGGFIRKGVKVEEFDPNKVSQEPENLLVFSHAALHHMFGPKPGEAHRKKYQEKLVKSWARLVAPNGKLLIVDVSAGYHKFLGTMNFDPFSENYLERIHTVFPTAVTTRLVKERRGVLEYAQDLKKVLKRFRDTHAELKGKYRANWSLNRILDTVESVDKSLYEELVDAINEVMKPMNVNTDTNTLPIHENMFKKLIGEVKPHLPRDFFDNVVANHSLTPHDARFVRPEELYKWLTESGLKNVFVGVLPTPWVFKNQREMVKFFRNIFGLASPDDYIEGRVDLNTVLTDKDIREAIKIFLGKPPKKKDVGKAAGVVVNWQLMYAYGRKPRVFQKITEYADEEE